MIREMTNPDAGSHQIEMPWKPEMVNEDTGDKKRHGLACFDLMEELSVPELNRRRLITPPARTLNSSIS